MLDFTYIYILTVIALIILITIIRRSQYFGERKNLYFVLAIFSDILILLGYVGRDLSEQLGSQAFGNGSNAVIYLCAPLSMFFLIIAATKKTDVVIKICCALEAVSAFIALASPFTGWFFTVSPEGIYSRGPLYLYNEILGILFVVIWGIYSYIEFSYVEPIDKIHIGELLGIQICAIILQGLNSTYKIIYICGAFMIMLYYAFITEVYGKYDKMTSVRNRAYYDFYLGRIKTSSRYSVIMFDANGLKNINDTLGHKEGDKLICCVASAVNKAVGQNGSVYRVGGDEFIAIIRSQDEETVNRINSEALSLLAEYGKGLSFEPTVSSGIAVHENGEEYSSVLIRAEEAMYKVKERFYEATGKERRI